MRNRNLIVPGKWFNEFAEDGSFLRAAYDDSYYRMLGYMPGEFVIQEFSDWSSRIHPDDVARVLAYVADVCSEHPEGMDYDIEYRMMTKNGFHWFHDNGHCTRYEGGSLQRCDGVAFDIQDIVEKVDEHQLLSENNARILALEDEFESFYDVNLETGEYYEYFKGQTYSEKVSTQFVPHEEFFKDALKNIDVVVYPDDRRDFSRIMNRDFLAQVIEKEKHYDYYYRLLIDGKPVWFRMRIVWKDEKKTNVIIGIFLAEKDMEAKQIAEQKEQLQEINLRNELLYEIAHAVKWSYEISADDEIVSYSYDNQAETIVRSEGFSGNPMAWLDQVHPDDRNAALQAFNAAIHDHSGDTPYDSTYRIIGVDGKYVWLKVSGRMHRRADGTGEMFGMSVDITDEVQEQTRRQEELDKSRKLIESVASSYDVAYAVSMTDDDFVLLKSTGMFSKKGKKFKNISEATDTFLQVIHPADRERMRQEMQFDTIRRRIAAGGTYVVEYRILDGNDTRWHLMNVTRIDDDNVVFGFADMDLPLTKKHLQNERFNDIFGLYEADLDTGMYKVIINSPYYTFSETGKAVPYHEAMLKFADCQVGETKEFFTNLADVEWLKKLLAKDNKHSFAYYSVTAGNTWVDVTSYVTLRHDDGTPAMVVFEFNFVSATAAAQQEMQRKLNESSQMISGLASGYDALYYINIDEHIFSIYTLNEKTYPDSRKAVEEKNDFYKAIRTYGMSEYIHPEDRHLFEDFSAKAIRERLKGNKKFSIRFRLDTGNGYSWNEMDVLKYEEADERANVVAVGFADRDSVIRAEQEYQQQLKEARISAEAANESKTNFLFNMSHDIRTPMNAITGFTNMAIKHIDDKEKVLDCLDKTQKAGTMLLSLINSVLEVSRIESGHAKLEEQPGDVYFSFANIENTMRQMADAKDISLSFEFGDVRDRFVYVDFSRCVRIFVNVISNAVKYTPEGGTVKVRCEQVGRAKDGFGTYKYTITDNGIGMSEEFQKHIFDQFAREQTTTVSGIEGSGLGMSVVKSFVDLMGGSVTVQSRQGEGSTFVIILPFRLQEREDYTDPVTGEIVSNRKGAKAAAKFDASGKKVLLVEDNVLNREIAIEILEEEGMIVEEADDGTVAVEKLREKGPDWYDFVLMDIQMPRMNGYDATKAIRGMYPDAKLPIIALSANAFAEDRQKSLAAGMSDHVAKPINISELLGSLAKFI